MFNRTLRPKIQSSKFKSTSMTFGGRRFTSEDSKQKFTTYQAINFIQIVNERMIRKLGA
jgi:hypothetical protein